MAEKVVARISEHFNEAVMIIVSSLLNCMLRCICVSLATDIKAKMIITHDWCVCVISCRLTTAVSPWDASNLL